MDQEKSLKFQNIHSFDEQLKQEVITLINRGLSYIEKQQLRACFESFKGLRLFIIAYEYEDKAQLDELTNVLIDYFESLENPNAYKRKDRIALRNKQEYELRELLDMYIQRIFKAYAELGLWFNTIIQKKDFDQVLSIENFNSDYTGVNDKKKVLTNLKTKEIISLLSDNNIHELHAKYLFKSMVSEDSE